MSDEPRYEATQLSFDLFDSSPSPTPNRAPDAPAVSAFASVAPAATDQQQQQTSPDSKTSGDDRPSDMRQPSPPTAADSNTTSTAAREDTPSRMGPIAAQSLAATINQQMVENANASFRAQPVVGGVVSDGGVAEIAAENVEEELERLRRLDAGQRRRAADTESEEGVLMPTALVDVDDYDLEDDDDEEDEDEGHQLAGGEARIRRHRSRLRHRHTRVPSNASEQNNTEEALKDLLREDEEETETTSSKLAESEANYTNMMKMMNVPGGEGRFPTTATTADDDGFGGRSELGGVASIIIRRKQKRATRQQRLGHFIDRAVRDPRQHFWVLHQQRGQPVMMRMFPHLKDLRAFVFETKERIQRCSLDQLREKIEARRRQAEARRLRQEQHMLQQTLHHHQQQQQQQQGGPLSPLSMSRVLDKNALQRRHSPTANGGSSSGSSSAKIRRHSEDDDDGDGNDDGNDDDNDNNDGDDDNSGTESSSNVGRNSSASDPDLHNKASPSQERPGRIENNDETLGDEVVENKNDADNKDGDKQMSSSMMIQDTVRASFRKEYGRSSSGVHRLEKGYRNQRKHRRSHHKRHRHRLDDSEDSCSCSSDEDTYSTGSSVRRIVRRNQKRGGGRGHHGGGGGNTNRAGETESTLTSSRTGFSSDSSSSSSSSESSSDEEETLWIDVQTTDPYVLRQVMQLFPNIRKGTIDSCIAHDDEDDLQNVHHFGYVACNLTVPAELIKNHHHHHHHHHRHHQQQQQQNDTQSPHGLSGSSSGSPVQSPMTSPGVMPRSDDNNNKTPLETAVKRMTHVSLIAMKRWCITLHEEPFTGLGSCMKRIHANFSTTKRNQHQRAAAAAAMAHAARGAPGSTTHPHHQHHHHPHHHQHQQHHADGSKLASPSAFHLPPAVVSEQLLQQHDDRNAAVALSAIPSPGALATLSGLPQQHSSSPSPESIVDMTLRPSSTSPAMTAGRIDGGLGEVGGSTVVAAVTSAGGAPTTAANNNTGVVKFAIDAKPPPLKTSPSGAIVTSGPPAAPCAAAVRRGPLLTVPWLVGSFIELIIDACLPDPLPILIAVDGIDEMVLRSQQRSVKRQTQFTGHARFIAQIAHIRRVLFTLRSSLNRKEHLLLQLVSSSLRSAYALRIEGAQNPLEHYKVVLASLTRISRRLEDAREALSQTNGNLVSLISTQQAQAANEMSYQMKILALVTCAGLPLTIVTSMFGMNVRVPWQTDDKDPSTTPFVIVVCVMIGWSLVSIPWLFWYFGASNNDNDDAAASDDELPEEPIPLPAMNRRMAGKNKK